MTTIEKIVSEYEATGNLTLAIRRADAGNDPFALGYRHGQRTRKHCSRREAESYFGRVCPDWTDADYELYLNGRDDGVRGDDFRMKGR